MLATDKEKRAEKEATLASFLSGATRILVTTDAALRALSEQLPPVGHVISFDFPPNMGEYAARLAHTACGGHTGRVTTFVNDATPVVVRSIAAKGSSCLEGAGDGLDGVEGRPSQ